MIYRDIVNPFRSKNGVCFSFSCSCRCCCGVAIRVARAVATGDGHADATTAADVAAIVAVDTVATAAAAASAAAASTASAAVTSAAVASAPVASAATRVVTATAVTAAAAVPAVVPTTECDVDCRIRTAKHSRSSRSMDKQISDALNITGTSSLVFDSLQLPRPFEFRSNANGSFLIVQSSSLGQLSFTVCTGQI